MNLSFAGCGFLGIYHVGVAVCFKKYAPHLLLGKISGASFGALSACCLLCELPIGEITTDVLRVVREARAGSLGPFSPSFNIQNVLLEGMEKYLPQDAHKIVSGKLHISLTRVYDGKNVIVSEFPTREDLLQALLASCFVPVFSGMLPPRFHGIRYMDGGFSDNLPVLDENTITVSPFCGESDICPRDLSSQLFHVNVANTSIELSKQNINRFARILFPPKPEVLSSMCKQGFDDALRFLHRNNLISCTRCLAVQTTFQLQDVLDDKTYEYDPDCEECKTHRQDALVDDLPDTVMTIFQNAIDSANHGLVNWVMRQRGMRYISLMTLPYRVPIDIMYATFTKFVTCTPKMSKSVWKLSLNMLQQLHGFLYSSHDKSGATAEFYYKLAKDAKKEDGYHLDRRRASEFRVTYNDVIADADTFEHILSVTSQNDAVLAYYYLDSENKVKMTEIYDVTDADTDTVQSPTERDVNKQLEFDNDWSAELMAENVQELQQQQALINQAQATKGRMERMARKPRGRMTAYAFFVQTCREELKKENPDENVIFAAFSKKCAERWNTMSEKEKARFHEMEDQDKKRYDLEMQNYVPPKDVKVGRQRKRQHNKYPNALKRSLSAFIWFCNDERSKVKANNPEYTMGDIAMELGLRWAAADPETKSKFEALSEQDKDRCDRVQMTDADTDTVQSPAERDVNKQLEFDNDWSAELMAVYGELDIDKVNEDDSDESDLDEVNEDGDRNLFSDPESEWAHHSESDVKSDDQIKKERT